MIDQTVRHEIEWDLQSNFLVEASAGTGKTHSLASRIVRGILEGAYAVDRLAAVTFTRKAAAELSGRIRLALEQAGAGTALARFDQLFVGTIHGFCGRLLRQFPLQAGVSPGFREIEEVEERRMRQRFLRAAWEEPGGRGLLRLLAEFDVSPGDLGPPLDCLVDHGDVEYPTVATDLPDLATAWNEVDSLGRLLSQSLPAVPEREPTCKLLITGRSFCRRLPQARRDGYRDLVRLLAAWESEPAPVKRYWGNTREEQNRRLTPVLDEVARFREQLVAPFLASCRAHLYGLSLPFLTRVRQRCQRERQKLALLNFNDLLTLCARMLRENEVVRRRLGEKFRHLLVDEFQDTDPTQAEIFFLLAGPGAHWREVVPRPASLFLVGDPKQSIYRFRRADIQTYNAVRSRIVETGGKVVRLETSFRSRAGLCHWLNHAFSQLLPAQPTPLQAPFSPLHSSLQDHPEAPVMRLTLTCPRFQDACHQEAELIAEQIQAWVCQRKTHRWGDFLILTARKAEVRTYQRALQSFQIPCQSVCDEGPLGRRAASFLPLLRHLADPQDKANLVGVLRGPMFGHSDEELFLHVQATGTLRPHPLMATGAPPSVSASLDRLNQWRLTVRWMPLGAAAALLLEETGLASLAAAEGPTRSAELRGIVDSLRRSGEAGLTLAQGVAELVERGAVELHATTFGSDDVVSIMNVHKAKGLEARVVFLAAPTAGFSLSADQVVTQGQGFMCLRKFRKPWGHPPQWSQLESQELEYLQAEQRRFLYVAGTRARETLVIGVWQGIHGSVTRPWRELHPFLQDCPALAPPSNGPAAAEARPETSVAEWNRLQERRESRRAPSWIRGSAAAGASPLKPTLPPDDIKVDAQDWGRLIHRLLESLARQPELSREQLVRLGRWYCFEVPGLVEALPAALKLLETVKASLLWEWLKGADDRLVELPYGVKAGGRLLFGTIDLALRREDGWGLVDYKTDRQRMEALVPNYARQVEHYARSWCSVIEEPLRYSGLFGVRETRLSPDLTPPISRRGIGRSGR